MLRRTTIAACALAGAATLVAGCGSSSSGGGTTSGGGASSSQSPQAELTSAVQALGNASTLTTTLKLGASASTLQSIGGSSNSLTSQQASAISGAALTIEVQAPSGKTISDLSGTGDGASAFTITDNGTTWASFTDVNKTLYIQLDLKDILNTLGQSATYQQLGAQTAALPPFVQALVAGKPVSVKLSDLQQLTGASGSQTPNASQTKALIGALKNILTNDVQVSRTTSGGTDNLTLTGNTKTIAGDFLNAASGVLPSAALSGANLSNVPSKDITLTGQVSGGALSQLSIDFGQFSPDPSKDHLPLVATFDRSGSSISAPSGAVPVDTNTLQSLLGSLGGQLGGGFGG